MTGREDLTHVIKELAVIHGRVTLVSGREADYCVDMRRVTLDGTASPLVGRVMSELVANLDFDAVEGLALGADPVATAILRARAATGSRLDAFVMRKEARSHGLQRRIGGTDITGRQALVVEDASTTGGSTLTVVEVVRRAGGEVVAATMVVGRAAEAAERVAKTGLEYRYAIGLEELGL